MNTIRLYFAFFLLPLFFSSSCELVNPVEPVPSYIRINEIVLLDSLTNQPAQKGSYRITDAWVSIDGKPQGVYELPATFPVLKEGSHQLIISPGILDNGIAASRLVYPFYTSFTGNALLTKDSIVELTPVVSYEQNSADFEFNEGFESAVGQVLDSAKNSKTDLKRVEKKEDSTVFEGNYSGLAVMNSTKDFFQCESTALYELPASGMPVYLEMNYKTDVEMTVGLIAETTTQVAVVDKITLFASPQWKKVYINLAPEISSIKSAYSNARFKVFMKANHNFALTESKIYLDNLKLIR